jgi:hypothetical protein
MLAMVVAEDTPTVTGPATAARRKVQSMESESMVVLVEE